MRAASSLLWCVVLLPVCLFFSACNSNPEQVAATQITVRIYAAEQVRARWTQLRLRSYRELDGEYVSRAEQSFDKRELGDVVDLVLVPRGSFDGTLLVVVDALDRDGQVLVQTRATFYFLTGQRRLLELWLYACGLRTLGELCSDADCEGDACLTCVDNRCQPTPFYDSNEFSAFDPKVEPKFKTPEWPDAGQPAAQCEPDCSKPDEGGAPEDASPSTSAYAGSDAADRDVDAGSGSRTDAGGDASMNGGLDASAEAGTDASMDAGEDTGADTGTDSGPDASDAGPTLSALGRCATWTTITLNGPNTPTPLPTNTRQLAEQTTANRGTLKQYLCRVTTPDGTLTPAKVSEDPAQSTPMVDYTCYAAWYDSAQTMWREFGNDALGARFEVLTPPSDCQLQWVAAPAAGMLPARALQTGGTNDAPLYSCRFGINTSAPDNVTRSGTHIGRVSGNASDMCRVQYYAGFRESATYEVLVQAN